MKRISLIVKPVATGFLLFCVLNIARAENIVSVCSPGSPPQSAKINLNAVVEAKLDASSSSLYHSYQLGVFLPQTVMPEIQLNQNLDITLPVIRKRQDKARITNITKQKLQLVISDQLQQLEGQVLTVQIPLKREGLYLIPPQAVYSSRGFNPQVFIIRDNRAATVPIEVIQVMDSGQVLISSSQLKNSKVICNGINNLVAGESVQVEGAGGGNL